MKKRNMVQDFDRILIRGDVETEVHGIGLREKIYEIGLSMQIKGRVENIKGIPIVQVICQREKVPEFVPVLRDKLPRYPLFSKVKIEDPKPYVPADYEKIKDDFELVRNDELTEMVWALQGAGRMFIHAQEQQRKLRLKNMLAGVGSEIPALTKTCDDIQAGLNMRFHPVSIEYFLKNPPDADGKMIEKLREIYLSCQEVNTLLDTKSPEDIVVSRVRNFRALLEKTPFKGAKKGLNNGGE